MYKGTKNSKWAQNIDEFRKIMGMQMFGSVIMI